jgi:hypothetical protein
MNIPTYWWNRIKTCAGINVCVVFRDPGRLKKKKREKIKKL